MNDYIKNAIDSINLQIEKEGCNNLWILCGDEGLGKTTLANEYRKKHSNSLVYHCNNELELCGLVSGIYKKSQYNRHIDLFEPLVMQIKEKRIRTIIFDIEEKVDKDFLRIIIDLFESLVQQKYKINIIFFIDTQLYRKNSATFAKYSRLIYLNPLKKWSKKELHQIWKENYRSDRYKINIIKTIIQYSIGNPMVFLQHLDSLKFYKMLVYENNKWTFVNEENILSVIKEQFSDTVRKKYDLLDHDLKEVIKQTSTIGYLFQKTELKEAFNLDNATILLKQIETICQLLYFTDSNFEKGKFESPKVHSQIERMIPRDVFMEWNLAVAYYYEKKLSSVSINSTEKYHLKEKCITYFRRAKKKDKIIYHIFSEIPILYSLNFFLLAHERAIELVSLTEGDMVYQRVNLYSYFLLLLINRKINDYSSALENLNTIKTHILTDQQPYIMYIEAELLYGIGDINNAYDLLGKLHLNINKIDDEYLKINITSMLSSVEETLNNDKYIMHYNQALSIAKDNHNTQEYYKLLRKANFIYSGSYGINLMEQAETFFRSNNDVIEDIMVKHNIATERIFSSLTFSDAKYGLEQTYKLACNYGFHQLAYTLNSLAIIDIFEKKYNLALEKLGAVLEVEQEDFTLLAIYLNQSTCYRKMGLYNEAMLCLNASKGINAKEGNKFPYFSSQIILQEAYLQIEQKNFEDAYHNICDYLECSFSDRDVFIISVKKVLKSLCVKYNFDYPSKITGLDSNYDDISEKIANDYLVLCELMFWE